jgi:preprotein translocase subunit SecE
MIALSELVPEVSVFIIFVVFMIFLVSLVDELIVNLIEYT